jgi:hypothetical protein
MFTARIAPMGRPLPSEDGAHKPIKARFWPWRSDTSPSNRCKLVPLRLAAGLGRLQTCSTFELEFLFNLGAPHHVLHTYLFPAVLALNDVFGTCALIDSDTARQCPSANFLGVFQRGLLTWTASSLRWSSTFVLGFPARARRFAVTKRGQQLHGFVLYRGGPVFKARALFASLNSRLKGLP